VIVPPPIARKHALVRPYVDSVATRVRDLVASLCEKEGYAYLGRIKDTESLAEKIETGRFGRWAELDDLFACSIIVPTLGDESAVIAHLQRVFSEDACKRRGGTRKDPSVFRFDATRFIGRLRPESVPNAAAELLAVRFEVQVRSAFEHAWSVTTHALAYKSTQVDWRHLRLAAQLRAAVEQLDQVVLGFEQNAQFIAEQVWPDVQARQRIWEFFVRLVDENILPTEVIPRSWGRFSENMLSLIISSSDKRIRNIDEYVSFALAIVDKEVRATKLHTFPRSVSLLQFCTGALARHKFFDGQPQHFSPLVTAELLSLFPEVKVLGDGFNLEL
jgi:Region found in RelA / SpoT proteins